MARAARVPSFRTSRRPRKLRARADSFPHPPEPPMREHPQADRRREPDIAILEGTPDIAIARPQGRSRPSIAREDGRRRPLGRAMDARKRAYGASGLRLLTSFFQPRTLLVVIAESSH